MSQGNETPEYPVNLFDEPRDHANQWDVSALFPERHPEPRKQKHARPTAPETRRSRDHANLWDVRALWPDHKSQPRDAK